MPITTIADMQIVPAKFTEYTIQRTTEKSALVNGGITTGNETVAQLINGTPKGGNEIQMPFFKPLTGEDMVFGEDPIEDIDGIETGVQKAALLIRQNAWGDTDLSHVYGGADPMTAITNLVGDWWVTREQKVILSILKGLLDTTKGCLKAHVKDISGETGDAAVISVDATLETKQTMGDAADSLGIVFMHSATYTKLQKNQDIETYYDATLQINIKTYLGYAVVVDDGMPVNSGVYDTYFIGAGAFIREYGTPAGLVTTEVDRDKLAAENYLINRRAYVMHPNGISWVANGVFTDPKGKYAANVDLEKPENWQLVYDHKKVPIVCLRHKI